MDPICFDSSRPSLIQINIFTLGEVYIFYKCTLVPIPLVLVYLELMIFELVGSQTPKPYRRVEKAPTKLYMHVCICLIENLWN